MIHFLLSTEIIPLCLRIIETGSQLSKSVAIFIVQKILSDETGSTYICHIYERFYAVGTVLSNMVNQLVETQAIGLLKHRCEVLPEVSGFRICPEVDNVPTSFPFC